MKELIVEQKEYQWPIFCPDATRGVIRGLDSADLHLSGVEGVVVNAWHLFTEPGISVIKQAGGIKKFMNWDGLVISDSGGFQLLSLIYRDGSLGKINEKGIEFKKSVGGKKKKYFFSPEKSIQIQFDLGADIMVCLDDCPREGATRADVELSVDRTIEWAKRCRQEFDRQVKNRKLTDRPKLIGVIQGGDFEDMRKKCAEQLKEIGFDGFGFGGWPLKNGNLDREMLRYVADLMPNDKIKYALGVGKPAEIMECVEMGYVLFDCVLPTRDGRHGRVYSIEGKELDLRQEKYVRDQRPIDDQCQCNVCQNYSRSYLHHLFMINDTLAGRLATMHNLYAYNVILIKLKNQMSNVKTTT